MIRCTHLAAVILFMIGACTPSPPALTAPATGITAPSETPTSMPSETPTLLPGLTLSFPPTTIDPSDTPSIPFEVQITDTPTQTPTPTLVCESETASLVVSADAQNIKIGDAVRITVKLSNEGCVALGLPQYRLYITSDGPQSILTPEIPDAVVHYLAVAPGQTDSTEFLLTAAAGGQASLVATASVEVHIGYPGPAYWGSIGSGQPLIITVEP